MPATTTDRLQDLLDLVRPEVRAQRAYRVATEIDEAAKLDQNESPYDVPEAIKRAAVEAFRQTEWNRYPPDRPHALARKLSETLDWPAEGIVASRGSNELTHTIGLTFVDQGTPVVLPHPMFALWQSVVQVYGGQPVLVDPQPDLTHSADDVIAAMEASQAPLTVVCTPNNPTGHAFTFDELRRMVEAAPGFFLIDEAYVEFQQGPTALDLLREHPQVLVMRTFSKAMGLAQLRLGYLLMHPEVAAEVEKARLPFLVDRLSEAVGIAMLERDDLVRERAAALTAERERIVAALRARGDVEVVPSMANFFIIRTPLPAATLQERLLEAGVRVRNVSSYPALAARDGRPGWVRVSVGTPAENSVFLDALERVLAAAAS